MEKRVSSKSFDINLEMCKRTYLNLGCGSNPIDGFNNVDAFDGKCVDTIVDLDKFPYPWKDNSIDYIYTHNTLEHLREPEKFWFEVHRILRLGGRIKVIVPHYKAPGAYVAFGHRSFFHQDAIKCLCPDEIGSEDNSVCRGFKLIESRVTRGRFLKWQKREIVWVVEKI